MSQVKIADALKNWRKWTTGSVDELAAIGTAFVWSLGLEPLPETTASTLINRRTIRYYISNDLMDAPDGERRLATYEYRHLLQLLYIKARQHAGDRLTQIREDLTDSTGRRLEQLVLTALPEWAPPPVPDDPREFARPANLVAVLHRWEYLTGRSGRYGSILSETEELVVGTGEIDTVRSSERPDIRMRVEINLADGISLTVPADHPLVDDEDGRALVLRGIQKLLRDYRRGGGPGGKES
jgi:DNA-binding transcriptional MerR regulator